MKYTICLAKTTIIFYAILTPIIAFASLYNLVKGVIMGQITTVGIGPFSLFGFILLPILLVNTYRQNKCVIQPGNVSIGKAEFPTSSYSFQIKEKYLAPNDRPITSLLRKTYYTLVVWELATRKVVSETDLSVFKSDIDKIRNVLPKN